MTTNDIPLDKAELLSVLLEGFLYGFSLFMFGLTISVLRSRTHTHQVNRRMLTVACLLLLFSTVHYVIDIIRIMEGLILFRDTYPGGPIGYFSTVSQWTFVYKNCVYTAQTLIGDGVILYRCYAVWQSKLVMVLPVLLWCAVGVTGIGSPYTASHVTQNEVFDGYLSKWIMSFFVSTLVTNLLTTFLLAYRIWSVDRTAVRPYGYRTSQMRTVLHIILDSGVIYSVTLSAALICFVSKSNGQYMMLDMITPIISITFYLVIIRVGLANQANQKPESLPLTSNSPDRRSRLQVHITTSSNSRVEDNEPSSMNWITPMGGENKLRSEFEFSDDAGEAV